MSFGSVGVVCASICAKQRPGVERAIYLAYRGYAESASVSLQLLEAARKFHITEAIFGTHYPEAVIAFRKLIEGNRAAKVFVRTVEDAAKERAQAAAKEVKRATGEAKSAASSKGEQVKDSASNAAENAQKEASRGASRAEDAFQSGKKEASESASSISEKISQAAEGAKAKAEDAWANIKGTVSDK